MFLTAMLPEGNSAGRSFLITRALGGLFNHHDAERVAA